MSRRKDATGVEKNRASKDWVPHVHFNDKGELLCTQFGIVPSYTEDQKLVTCKHCLKRLAKYNFVRNK